MRRGSIAVGICCAVTLSGWADEGGTELLDFDGGRRIDAVFEGAVGAWTVDRDAAGRSRLYVLVTPASGHEADEGDRDQTAKPREGPCDPADTTKTSPSLWEWPDPMAGRPGPPLRLPVGIPDGVTSLRTVDVDGDGNPEVLLSGLEGLWRLRLDESREPELEPIFSAERVGLGEEMRLASWGAPGEEELLPLAGIGETRFYRPDLAGAWREAGVVRTPVRVSRRSPGFVIDSPALSPVGRHPERGQVWLSTPEPAGDRRLRILRVEPENEDPELRVQDCWAHLPGPEEILESKAALLDGEPVLIVTTRPSDRLNLLGEKRLRIFPVKKDRSRLGYNPLLAVETRINLWQTAVPHLIDVDGDDRQDLVLGYYKGLKDDRVVLDTYLRNTAGGFAITPSSTSFDVDDADRSYISFGEDLDGDGRFELILLSEKRIHVHRGSADVKRGKKLVSKKPDWIVPADLPSGDGEVVLQLGGGGASAIHTPSDLGRIRAVDLDGDGMRELVFSSVDENGKGIVSIARFDAPRATGDRRPGL